MDKILVVDVDQRIAATTAEYLAAAGYAATPVTTFNDALDNVARECPDLLITAVRLGAFNGLDLARRSRQHHPDLPILVMGVGTDRNLAKEATAFDVHFEMRPATYPEILKLVRDLLPGLSAEGDFPPDTSEPKPIRPRSKP